MAVEKLLTDGRAALASLSSLRTVVSIRATDTEGADGRAHGKGSRGDRLLTASILTSNRFHFQTATGKASKLVFRWPSR